MSETLDDYLHDPVMLDELMLVTKVMIATRRVLRPMPQEQIDQLLGIDPVSTPVPSGREAKSIDAVGNRREQPA